MMRTVPVWFVYNHAGLATNRAAGITVGVAQAGLAPVAAVVAAVGVGAAGTVVVDV